ncbi:MAG TPA: hypothetical protein VNZ25_08765 [Candidatus Angelobacter sp.]|nr:hypothetical protein [Candidatus Angelobacter sp.]
MSDDVRGDVFIGEGVKALKRQAAATSQPGMQTRFDRQARIIH